MSKSPASTERWFFYQDRASLWKWARLDLFGTVLGDSASVFGSREDSVADAHRNGYREGRLASGATPSHAVRRSPWTGAAATHTDPTPGSETPESPSS